MVYHQISTFTDISVITAWSSLFLHPWLFFHPSELNYTGQAAQFENFLNRSATLLNSVFKIWWKKMNSEQISDYHLSSTSVCFSDDFTIRWTSSYVLPVSGIPHHSNTWSPSRRPVQEGYIWYKNYWSMNKYNYALAVNVPSLEAGWLSHFLILTMYSHKLGATLHLHL